MQITETTKTHIPHQRPPVRVKAGRPGERPPIWRPQPSSLTRDELRKIVLDTLG